MATRQSPVGWKPTRQSPVVSPTRFCPVAPPETTHSTYAAALLSKQPSPIIQKQVKFTNVDRLLEFHELPNKPIEDICPLETHCTLSPRYIVYEYYSKNNNAISSKQITKICAQACARDASELCKAFLNNSFNFKILLENFCKTYEISEFTEFCFKKHPRTGGLIDCAECGKKNIMRSHTNYKCPVKKLEIFEKSIKCKPKEPIKYKSEKLINCEPEEPIKYKSEKLINCELEPFYDDLKTSENSFENIASRLPKQSLYSLPVENTYPPLLVIPKIIIPKISANIYKQELVDVVYECKQYEFADNIVQESFLTGGNDLQIMKKIIFGLVQHSIKN
jgi:hypothetical protein